MAGRLTRATACIGLATLVALTLAAAPAARALDDPTRPPPGHLAGTKPAASSGNRAAELVLQSVIISEAGRAAIINGERVAVGARIGAARVVKVGEAEVVLLIGSTRRTLSLYPGVNKQQAWVGGGDESAH